ncbi:sensor domain-containing diguanylate cyclase [Ruminococcus sp.]|uniref:sensor domain-containing diguanylate cyclase n=1 Tax=Ruminococcus sp. TaxID=41978 RepID=UPI0025D3E997|nr:sensor domain-containing diguanylate cyclase [Ruminococcus sp.]MBQ8966617.1 sensor domain-containing diguanylate cyclase [Ruminococcus sp.]
MENYKAFADNLKPMTCIMSVRREPDVPYGEIRIVTGNAAYFQAGAKWSNEALGEQRFVPNQPYETYIPKNLNFEEYCYRSALLGETLHSYLKPDYSGFWIHTNYIPLNSDEEDIGYCAYTMEFETDGDVGGMTALSPDIMRNVLRTCIELKKSENFEESADKVIHDIREMTNAHHCCILLTDFDQRQCSVLCEALSEDTDLVSMNIYADEDFIDIAATWDDTIAGDTCIIMNEERDWEDLKKRNSLWYQSLRDAGAKSMVLLPLRSQGSSLGYLWAINYDVSNTVKIKETLELTAYFLASEIANYQLVGKLKSMSLIDMLTGVGNRNALNESIEHIKEKCAGDRYAVIFADVNSLKETNDCKGHSAGDLLLRRSAVALQAAFPVYPFGEVFRVGGDEFVVIASCKDETAILEGVECLKKRSRKNDGISIALGCCIDVGANISEAIQKADEIMYEDKRTYHDSRD